MRFTHSWPSTATHELKTAARFLADCRRALALPVVFALTFGGCQDDITSPQHASPALAASQADAPGSSGLSQLAPPDPIPSCSFDQPFYRGFVYNFDLDQPGPTRLVDLWIPPWQGVEGPFDYLTWTCTPGVSTAFPVVAADPQYPEDIEGFSMTPFISPDHITLWYLRYDGSGLPDPDWRNWKRRMVFELWSPDTALLLAQSPVTVTLCPSVTEKLVCIEHVMSSDTPS